MTLTLDVSQRLNLVAVLDAYQCQGRREAFAVCRLQEKIDLDEDERKAAHWEKVPTPNGQEYVTWNLAQAATMASKDIELPDDDIARICRSLDQFNVVLGRDRFWWKPLVAQLPAPVESNGTTKKE